MTAPPPSSTRAPLRARASTRERWARALLLLAGVAYLTMFVEIVVGFPFDLARSYLSELAAGDQPTSSFVRWQDAAGAFLILLGMVLARRRWRRAELLVALGLALLAVATLADSLLPLDCAPSLSGCAALEASDQVSMAHRAHTVSSSLAGLGASAAAVGTGLSWWRREGRYLRIAALTASAVVTGATLIVVLGEFANPHPWGIVQRIQIIATTVVIAIAGWTLTGREFGRNDGGTR